MQILQQIGDAMQTTIRPRVALSALLIAASITLAGCGAATAPPAVEETPSATPTTSDGFLYEDTSGGYSVTFPGEPEVQTAPADEFGGEVTIAIYSTASLFYMSQAKVEYEVEMPDLPNVLINSAQASGAVIDDGNIEGLEFNGLPAFRADVTMSDGTPGTVLVVTDIDSKVAYQLVVTGASPEERQAFFDTFELLD